MQNSDGGTAGSGAQRHSPGAKSLRPSPTRARFAGCLYDLAAWKTWRGKAGKHSDEASAEETGRQPGSQAHTDKDARFGQEKHCGP